MPPNPTPKGDNLLARIQRLENLLGVNGVGPNAYAIKDGNGVQRVRVGALQNGDYGLLLTDVLGNNQELLPVVSAYYASALVTTSNTPVSIASSPAITAVVGASGDAAIEVASYIAAGSVAQGGGISLYVDGAVVNGGNNVLGIETTAAAGVGASCYSGFLLSQVYKRVAPGSHTFTLKYMANTTGTIEFLFNSLKVTPV